MLSGSSTANHARPWQQNCVTNQTYGTPERLKAPHNPGLVVNQLLVECNCLSKLLQILRCLGQGLKSGPGPSIMQVQIQGSLCKSPDASTGVLAVKAMTANLQVPPHLLKTCLNTVP